MVCLTLTRATGPDDDRDFSSIGAANASVTITFDRYGHLMPGNEDEAGALLDAYLGRANTRARVAQTTE
jgi:hypothetical protein